MDEFNDNVLKAEVFKLPDSEYIGRRGEILNSKIGRADMQLQELEDEELVWENAKYDMESSLSDALKQVRPLLPVPASREECLEGIEVLKKCFHKTIPIAKEVLIRDVKAYLQKVVDLRAMYGTSRREKVAYLRRIQKSTVAWAPVGYKYLYISCMAILQGAIHDMMEGQDEELRLWLLEEENEFSKHLHRGGQWKPEVHIEDRSRASGLVLPPEITSLIYAHSDLMSCVKLRQVSAHFYNVFQVCESLMEKKIRQRHHWLKPEGELKTWGDCVLVLANRMADKRWKTAENLEKMKIKARGDDLATKLVVPKLQHGETLPEGFESVNSHYKGCKGGCDSAHFSYGDDHSVLDLRTLTLSNASFEQHEIVSSNKTGTVIKYGGLEITLPSRIKRADVHREQYSFSRDTVRLGRYFVIVKTKKGFFVFPRDKELHFEHAHLVQSERHPIEVGKLLAVSVSIVEDNDDACYRFHDFEAGTSFDYAPQSPSKPVAVYEGVLWWYVFDKGLVPTFIDMESPEKIYYRRDRTTYVPDIDIEFVHCSNPRYLVIKSRHSDMSTTLVDLLTGHSTSVQGQPKDHSVKAFSGFVKDRFSPRYITSELGRRYQKELATGK